VSSAASHAPGAEASEDGPVAPGGHEGHKLKIEIGHGSITGAITLSIELGKTGVPLPDHLKLLKNTLSMKLNGFVAKLETVVLNGNLDAEVLDGVKVAVDVSAFKLSSDEVKPDDNLAVLDLLTVALKLQGDVGHWVDVGPNVKVTLEGQVQMALGGKLAAQFAKYTVAQLDRMMLAKETEVVGEALAKHVDEIERIESQLAKLRANRSAARREIQALEQELFRHRIQVSTGNQQLKGLTRRLGEARGRVRTALGKIEGKFAKKIAWAMEKKAVKHIAKCLAKLMPILNIASTVVDVIEVIKLVRDLIKHRGKLEIGGGDESADDAASVDGADGGVADSKTGDRGVDGGDVPAGDENGGREAGAARAPAGASPTDTSGSKAPDGSAGDGGAATNGRTVTVDGVARPDLAHSADDDGSAPTGEGPITSPSQIDAAAKQDDAFIIVHEAPPAVIGRWFRADEAKLVLSEEGARWQSTHVHQLVGGEHLMKVAPVISRRGEGRWDLQLRFELRPAGQGVRSITHRFLVERGEASSLGAQVGDLAFEPYVMLLSGS
jgi:hypothetical protein